MKAYEAEFSHVKGNTHQQEKRMIEQASSIKQRNMELEFKDKTIKNQNH